MAVSKFGTSGKLAMLAAATCAAGSASAAMPGLYFAGFYMDSTLAYSSVDANVAGFDQLNIALWDKIGGDAVPADSIVTDKTDIGYSFSVGYQLTEYFAAEFTYLDMGTVNYESGGTVSDSEGTYQADLFMSAKTKGPMLTGIAVWPLGDRFSLDARAGMLFGSSKVRASLYIDQQYWGNLKESVNRNAVMLGAGINWSMAPGTAIRAGYSRIGKGMIDQYDISSWTLGLKYAW